MNEYTVLDSFELVGGKNAEIKDAVIVVLNHNHDYEEANTFECEGCEYEFRFNHNPRMLTVINSEKKDFLNKKIKFVKK